MAVHDRLQSLQPLVPARHLEEDFRHAGSEIARQSVSDRQHNRKSSSCRQRRKRGEQKQAIGVSRGGRSTKIHAIVDSKGRPLNFTVTGGQVHDSQVVGEVLDTPRSPLAVAADEAYDSEKVRPATSIARTTRPASLTDRHVSVTLDEPGSRVSGTQTLDARSSGRVCSFCNRNFSQRSQSIPKSWSRRKPDAVGDIAAAEIFLNGTKLRGGGTVPRTMFRSMIDRLRSFDTTARIPPDRKVRVVRRAVETMPHRRTAARKRNNAKSPRDNRDRGTPAGQPPSEGRDSIIVAFSASARRVPYETLGEQAQGPRRRPVLAASRRRPSGWLRHKARHESARNRLVP